MILTLQEIKFFIPNLKEDFEQRSMMTTMFRQLGLQHEFVPAVNCAQGRIGRILSILKILDKDHGGKPFGIMSDACIFSDNLQDSYEVPEDTDALYLGQSRFGISTPGDFSWGKFNCLELELYNSSLIRVYNNLGSHCLIIISEEYKEKATKCLWDALVGDEIIYPYSVALASLQLKCKVLSPVSNPSFLHNYFTNNQSATEDSIYFLQSTRNLSELGRLHAPNTFLYTTVKKTKYYLFYDLFVHWSRKKITAVAPFYGKDMDLRSAHEIIYLTIGDLTIQGTYIPCRLDSWEPSILIDFEHPELEKRICGESILEIKVECEGMTNSYLLESRVPRFPISMSAIVKNENRWLPFFLEYYLDILKVDHIYLYDNLTHDKEGLHKILAPNIRKARITLIPWDFRWRNRIDRKQIGQPPQQSHTLNKFGAGNWIGFFDVDEFLKIPKASLAHYMRDFNPQNTGGVSFGLRWFFYKGPKSYEEIVNPLLEFKFSKRDSLGRKRQKLMVSPQLCRYIRFHWIPDDQVEFPVEDEDIYFHHYAVRKKRFEEWKTGEGVHDNSLARKYAVHSHMGFLKKHLDGCFENARKEKSKLTETSLAIEGYIGKYNRHFYNNLCSMPGTNLLEIGLWKGASSCACLDGNLINATFIDNWKQFRGPKNLCIQNIRKHSGASRVKIISEDCFEIDGQLLDKYNIYIYDGHHLKESHYKAIVNFYEHLMDFAIVVVDDWNRKHIRKATFKAIKDLKISVFYEREILLNPEELKSMPSHKGEDTWWNGIYVFALNKN